MGKTKTDTNAEAETNTETEIPFRVSVYPPATEENPEPEAIPAEEDGSFLLLPGNYAYTAEAEGYAPIDLVADCRNEDVVFDDLLVTKE